MSGPVTRHDAARVEVKFQRGVQRGRRPGIGYRLLPAHRRDHAVHLAERQRCRREQGGPVGHPDGVPQLGGDGRPRGVAVAAVQVRAAQTAWVPRTVVAQLRTGNPPALGLAPCRQRVSLIAAAIATVGDWRLANTW
jgi:hypothetical protein